jgi:HlyD family secretion protein
VDNEDLKLKPGMTANVSIITNKSENVICVPNIALKFSPNTDGQKYKNQGIWILKNNKPQRIDVEVGASDDSKTEISNSTLSEGNKVIVGILGKSSSKNSGNNPKPPGMF